MGGLSTCQGDKLLDEPREGFYEQAEVKREFTNKAKIGRII